MSLARLYSLEALRKAFDETKVNRVPAGSSRGGQFTTKDGAGASTVQELIAQKQVQHLQFAGPNDPLYQTWLALGGNKLRRASDFLGKSENLAPASVTTKYRELAEGGYHPGKCYEYAGKFAFKAAQRLTEAEWADIKIVHGAIGNRDTGALLAHAWVEIGDDVVFDGVRQEFYNKDEYYDRLGAVAERTYPLVEYLLRAYVRRTYGPWEKTAGMLRRDDKLTVNKSRHPDILDVVSEADVELPARDILMLANLLERVEKAFDESRVNRHPAGSPKGGQFAPKGTASAAGQSEQGGPTQLPTDFNAGYRVPDPKDPPMPTPGKPWTDTFPGLPSDTLVKYTGPDGRISPDRQRVHEAIFAAHLDGKPSAAPGEKPIAILMMGGPASGKTTVLNGMDTTQMVHIDSDIIKTMLPEYRWAVQNNVRSAARMVHEESSYLSKAILDRAMSDRKSLVFDGTGGNFAGYARMIEKLKAAGYHITVVAMDADENAAVQRANSRAQRTGRFVPEDYIRTTYQKVRENFNGIAKLVDGFRLYDNTGSSPELVAEGRAGAINVLNEKGKRYGL